MLENPFMADLPLSLLADRSEIGPCLAYFSYRLLEPRELKLATEYLLFTIQS